MVKFCTDKNQVVHTGEKPHNNPSLQSEWPFAGQKQDHEDMLNQKISTQCSVVFAQKSKLCIRNSKERIRKSYCCVEPECTHVSLHF